MKFSSKRILISKANTLMFGMVVGASIIVSFSLVTVRMLFSEMQYQQKVIGQKNKALKQIKENLQTARVLEQQYQEFERAPDNIIGGSATGTGERDGTNAKVILDALPSKYDFPALTTSLDGMVKATGINLETISGIDNEIAEFNKTSPKPEPQPMDFGLSVSGNYEGIRNLVFDLERSIRPIQLTGIDMAGNDASIRLRVTAKTYYQPEKDLTLTKKEVQ